MNVSRPLEDMARPVMNDKKPLWEVMRDAARAIIESYPPFCAPEGKIIAAELRAIADEAAPERPEPNYDDMEDDVAEIAEGRWSMQMDIRRKLLKAAAEAEDKS
jgi:hypothetical protein